METQATTKLVTGSAAIIEGADIVAGEGNLQTAITELVEFPYQPDTAAWVTKVSNAPTEVIAVAIARWVILGGVTYVAGDPMAPRREAAMAILHARFAADTARQTDQMLGLTKQIKWLTWAMLLAVLVQILLTLK
jgi:hypothetical protein